MKRKPFKKNLVRLNLFAFSFGILYLNVLAQGDSEKIDRYSLINRHNVKVATFDIWSPLSAGNGEFAITVDATGLQTFPEYYERGIYLGTQSQWGWHNFPNTEGYTYDETLKYLDFHGRKIGYYFQIDTPVRNRNASNYFRINPHRLHLGFVGFELIKPDGEKVRPEEIKNIHQVLDLWKGEIRSHFEVMGFPVDVVTICDPNKDLVSVKAISSLISQKLLSINLHFPNPTGKHTDGGYAWDKPGSHQSQLHKLNDKAFIINRTLDSTKYYVSVNSVQKLKVVESELHKFVFSSEKACDTLTISCSFSQKPFNNQLSDFVTSREITNKFWKEFWISGGAVDFTGSTDARAFELERRIVLSQYLLAIQCAGSFPPQETGLTFNSWFGKYHLEMHWWHALNFALWNRTSLLEKSLSWYAKVLPQAKELAKNQGFQGARWQKMTDTTGNYCPSSIGSVLIWQQPHIIYFAEMIYRQNKSREVLDKYKELVFETARFMESYTWYDKEEDRYILGPSLIPAQESLPVATTINPPYELAYWYWGLSIAQQWRKRLGMPAEKRWDEIITKLSPLAKLNGLYLAAESAPDSYTNQRTISDHPAVFGAFGVLPYSPLLNKDTMANTFNYILHHWHWEDTWGWDFPLTAMTATRLDMPEKAVDALFMESKKNTYLANGHNYQNESLRIYLPGNGALLNAIALMCAGYDGCKISEPGFPKNGAWKVKWENLYPLP